MSSGARAASSLTVAGTGPDRSGNAVADGDGAHAIPERAAVKAKGRMRIRHS